MRTDPQPLLSLCMIVKDEIAGLEACIESVHGLVDEVVVVDTGSTDGTWELAQAISHRHTQIEWEDHFGRARNVALGLATGKYVLILDGDERLQSGHDQVRAAVNEDRFIGGELRILNRLSGGEVGEFWACRLFKNRPDIRWHGRIHEQVITDIQAVVSAEPRSVFRRIDSVIEHHGYLPEHFERKGKAERNVRLLSQAVAELDDEASLAEQIYIEYKLATAIGAGPVGANHLLRAAQRALSAPLSEISSCAVAAELLVSASQLWRVGGAIEQAKRAAERAGVLAPEHPMPQLMLGHAHLAAGDIEGASQAAGRAGDVGGGGFHFNRVDFDVSLSVLRAVILERTGDIDGAIDVMTDLVCRHPTSAAAGLTHVQMLSRLAAPEEAVKAGVAHMKKHGATAQALSACAQAAERAGRQDKAAEWRRLAESKGQAPG